MERKGRRPVTRKLTSGKKVPYKRNRAPGSVEAGTITRSTKVWGEIRNALPEILDGVILSIDPSSGSTSSMPGWALYRKGELVESGIIEISYQHELPYRLRELHKYMHQLIDEFSPDVLVYEDLPPRHYRGGKSAYHGNDKGHASLLKSLGVIISIPGPDFYVGIHPLTWKRLVREDYVKGDESDAIEMGYIVINQAHKIAAGLPKHVWGIGSGKSRSRLKSVDWTVKEESGAGCEAGDMQMEEAGEVPEECGQGK
jgi:hypothetical protein